MTGSGRPPKPARERELRARTFGEAVDQEMERQAKLNGRAQITDVLYQVRRRLGFPSSDRTAWRLLKDYRAWQQRREADFQEILTAIGPPGPRERHLLTFRESISASVGGLGPVEQLQQLTGPDRERPPRP
ncbi:MAG: hypothetical protein ACJ8CS_24805, partial [Microvirga sp.]